VVKPPRPALRLAGVGFAPNQDFEILGESVEEIPSFGKTRAAF
jgi:hypothetical protein